MYLQHKNLVINVECTIKNLITLKNIVEKQLGMKFGDIDKTRPYIVYFISDNPDIYEIFMIYNNNMKLNYNKFYGKHKQLLERINLVLLLTCDHCWDNDNSYGDVNDDDDDNEYDIADMIFRHYTICICQICHIRKWC